MRGDDGDDDGGITDTVAEAASDDQQATNWRDELADGLGLGFGVLVGAPIGIAGRTLHVGARTAIEVGDTFLPFTDRLYQGAAAWSVNQLYKDSGADAIGAVITEGGEIELHAAKLKETELTDEGVEGGGWTTRAHDRVWTETADGRDIARLGKAPLIWLPESSTRRVAPIEARVQRAIETGNWQHVFRVEQPGAIEMDVSVQAPDASVDGAAQALADGGYDAAVRDIKHGVLEDTLVDISDPQRVSFNAIASTYREAGDVERMDEQERLGFEAGRLDAEETDVIGQVIKLLLVIGLLLAIVTIGPDVLGQAASAGGGGGGGGSIVPFMLGGLV